MNFFKTLSETGIKDVVLQVKQDSTGNITVFVTPKTVAEDSALKGLKPLHLTGTPEELDTEFFGLVTSPLQKTQNIFNNVEAFEAQLREASKTTADKKAEKDAAAKAKKETSGTDVEKEVPVEKPMKVNNEKALKDFMASIKGENILSSKDKIEELYANLSEVELGKPFAKKVRIDLDIAIRKEANIQAAREKHGFATKPEETQPVDANTIEVVEEPAMTEQTSDIPEFIPPVVGATEQEMENLTTQLTGNTKATDAPTLLKEAVMEVVKEVPNVEPATMPIPVEAPSTEEVKPVVVPPVPVAAPAAREYEEVLEFQMICTEYTKEQYYEVGWTDEVLVQEGKAHYFSVMKEIVPVAQKLSYTFPKQFDAPEEE